MTDWKKIKAEYIRGGVSYRKLAEKHGVSLSTITKIGMKEKWADLRKEVRNKSETKLVESASEKEAKRVNSFSSIADLLQQKIKEGIEDGRYIVDAQSTRAIISALKDLKEVKGERNELDVKEQIARIEKLHKEVQTDETSKDIRVVIENGLDDYAK